MKKLPTDTADRCWDILSVGIQDAGQRTNEDHLRPGRHIGAINEAVQRLKGAGISTVQVATFSHALSRIDGFTAACLRSQDSRGLYARDAFVNDYVQFILPFGCENSEAQKVMITGLAVTSLKNARYDRAYAVMLVILRGLMRLLLEEKADEEGREKGYHKLCAVVGPFDHKRKFLTTHAQARLFQVAAAHYLGLPRLATRILLSVHISMVIQHCCEVGIELDKCWVVAILGNGRDGREGTNMAYNIVQARNTPFAGGVKRPEMSILGMAKLVSVASSISPT